MSRIDDRILEYGFEHSYMTTKTLHSVFDVTRTYINRRLGVLMDMGLVYREENTVYHTSEQGAHYLAGTYDVENEEYTIDDPDDASLQSWEDVGRLSDENYIG